LGLDKLEHIVELADPKQIPKCPSKNLWLPSKPPQHRVTLGLGKLTNLTKDINLF